MVKKIINILLSVIFILSITCTLYAKEPKFKLHIIHIEGQETLNYSVNMPVVFDYDGDGDQDIVILGKNSVLYVWENITNN